MNYQTTPELEMRPASALGSRECLFAWLSIFVGFLFARALPAGENPLGTLIFFLLLFAFGGFYVFRSGLRLGRTNYLIAAIPCLFSLGLVTGANAVLRFFLVLFLFFAFLYWIYTAFGLKGGTTFDDRFVSHALYSIFVLPLSHFYLTFPALGAAKEGSGKRLARGLLFGLCGLGIAIIPTAIVFALLSFDEGFVKLVEDLLPDLSEDFPSFVGDLFLGVIFAAIFFGALVGASRLREKFGGKPNEIPAAKTHFMPRSLVCASVTPILLLYVIFFVSQWDWYISAFTHRLPESLTYAEYARNGFFQLCWVCAINAVMLLFFNLFIRETEGRRDPIRLIYSCLISVFTLVLIATALSKMLLYIDSYGLTRKRVYASWFMLLLAAIFVAVLLRQFVRKIPLVATVVVICLVFFAGIVLPNVDGAIADYNVDAYLSGELDSVDVESLAEYGASAVPALVHLRDSLGEEDAELREQVQNKLKLISWDLSQLPDGFFAFNIPTVRARRLLAEK